MISTSPFPVFLRGIEKNAYLFFVKVSKLNIFGMLRLKLGLLAIKETVDLKLFPKI